MRTFRFWFLRIVVAVALASSTLVLMPGAAQAISIPWPLADVDLGHVPAIPFSASVVITNSTPFDITVDSATIASDHQGDVVTLDVSSCLGITFHPGEGCTASIAVTPSSLGERTFTGAVSGTASYYGIPIGISGTFIVQGTLVSLNVLQSVNLGDVQVGVAYPWGYVYTNTSPAPVTFSAPVITFKGMDGSALTADASDCVRTLQIGDSCTIDGTFTGPGLGARSASAEVDVQINGIPAYVTVDIFANGVPAPAMSASPTNVAFPSTVVRGTPATADVTLLNTSGAPQSVNSVGIDGANEADFAIASDGCSGATLAVDATCGVTVAFAPADRGARSASLIFVTTAPSSQLAVPLTGTGIAPVVTTDPATLSFGTIPVGTTSAQQVLVVSNVGDAPLHVSSSSIAGSDPNAYVVTDDTCTGAAIAAGSTCVLAVAFAPDGLGPSSAALVVADDEAAGRQTISLSGAGSPSADVAVSLKATPGSVVVGQTLTYLATVRNAGPSSALGTVLNLKLAPSVGFVSASLPCTVPDEGGTGTVVCSFGVLASGSSTTLVVAVTVEPSAPRRISATASVKSATFDPHTKDDHAKVSTRVTRPQQAPQGRHAI